MEKTPEQQSQLKTWSEERDALLSEISSLRTEKEKIIFSSKEASASVTDAETRANIVKGRIEELLQKEKDLELLTSKELADLNSQKTVLQTEIFGLKNEIAGLKTQKDDLNKDLLAISDIISKVDGKAKILDEAMEHVVGVSKVNISSVQAMTEGIRKMFETMSSSHEDLIKKSGEIATELPKVFLEVKRQSLERTVINKKKE